MQKSSFVRWALAWAGAGLVAASAHAAGTVTVSFTQPEQYADARDRNLTLKTTLATLDSIFQSLGRQYLAPGQQLALEVTEVDLAGRENLARPNSPRIMTGAADWPRIELRYTLTADGQVKDKGNASIVDMNYLQRASFNSAADEPLPYERRMLRAWFQQTFGQPAAASATPAAH